MYADTFDEAKYMATFQVYSDESGEQSDPRTPYVVFASIVFAVDEMAAFMSKWDALLADAGIRYVSMKEAMNYGGQFREWANRQRDRDDLLEALVSLAQDRCSFCVHSAKGVEDFHSLPKSQRARLKKIVYGCFEAVIKMIAGDARVNPSHRFHLIYDLAPSEQSHGFLDLFIKLRQDRVFRQFFPSLAFADDEEFPALQAADILAFCEREKFLKRETFHTGIVRKLLSIWGKAGKTERRNILYVPGAALGQGIIEEASNEG